MIRRKRPEADLKRTYRRVLSRSMGLSFLLHLAVFVFSPTLEFQHASRSREPIVIKLEAIPETRQHIPLPLPLLYPAQQGRVDTFPRRHRLQTPSEVVTEFALEEEDEVVEFWMVEKRPRVLRQVLPEYPDSARQALIEGRVFVRILVDRQGRVARVGRITGPRIFHQAAAAAAWQWEFTPAVQNDRTVRVWVSLPFTFQLE